MDKVVATIDEPAQVKTAVQPPQPVKDLNPSPPQVVGMGMPRAFLGNRFVYAVISQRANGLSIGVNMNPDKFCNFDCEYCEVNRSLPGLDSLVDLEVMTSELENLLTLACQRRLRELPQFRTTPEPLLALKSVALSGDGEPTLCSNFAEIVRRVVHVRSHGKFPFFKLVLLTNTAGLDRGEVRDGLGLLTSLDEIWAKLDAGTQEYMNRLNRTTMTLDQVLSNILALGRERPVVIQSLFPLLKGQEPPSEEIEHYVHRLKDLKEDGARISLVQIYSAHRPPHRLDCGHLKLKTLSRIAQRVREVAGLRAEVF
jgi:wyosine [tRNA(Phe)-imidazoG37] synthetase (radical SAM superfamily)